MSICRISALRADFLWRNWTWSFFDYCGQFFVSHLLGWSYSTLRKNVSIFLGGNSREKGGHTREKGGNTRADSTWLKNENMKWSVCSWNGNCYFEMDTSFKKWTENKPKSPWTEICDQWISTYDQMARQPLHPPLSQTYASTSGATKHSKKTWNNTVSRDFSTFLRALTPCSSFYWLFLFWLVLFSDCSHHCCCICP